MDAEEEAQTEAAFNEPQKFVNLVDILPKLPEKGEFSVQTIKNSLYFFS
jgi:DNA-directed RNA polymerase